MDQDATAKFLPGLVVIGLIFLALLYLTVDHARSRSWPTTEARVTSADHRTFKSVSVAGTSSENDVLLHYAYEVDGQEHVGKQSFGRDPEGWARYEALRAQPTITVHYDPKKPADAWIDGNKSAMRYLLIIDGLLGGLLAFMIWRWRTA